MKEELVKAEADIAQKAEELVVAQQLVYDATVARNQTQEILDAATVRHRDVRLQTNKYRQYIVDEAVQKQK